jgi:hypothetical protein
MINIRNLTPHELNIVGENGETITRLAPSGDVARVGVSYTNTGEVAGLPVYTAHYGEVEGLPEPRDGVILIVSGMVQQAVPERPDVYAPGELVRDSDGKPIGCRGLKGGAQ